MSYVNSGYLTSTEDLASAIESDKGKLRVYEATVTLVPAEKGYTAQSGLQDYQQAHIPGAAFMDLIKDLSDTTSPFGFTLPSSQDLQTAYQALGIDDDSQVVLYSSGHMMWATRAWWMLHSCGHQNVSVLDGGFRKWQAENRAVNTEASNYSSANMTVNLDQNLWANKEKMKAAIDDSGICTINALSPGVYSGESKMSYGRKGHIENSHNVFYDEVLDKGCFRTADELQKLFTEKGVLDKPKIIAYCGGGISATIDALALKLIGHQAVSVYDGSMSEWASDESLPLVTGANPI